MVSSHYTLKFENSQPVDLMAFSESMAALGHSYEEFAIQQGISSEHSRYRLYIKEIRSGSILAEIIALANQASMIMEKVDIYAGFVTHLNDITQFFLGKSSKETKTPSKREAEKLSQIVAPIAQQTGAQLTLINNAPLTINFTVNSDQANILQNRVRAFLGKQDEAQDNFEKEILYLEQIRKDIKAKTGDRGIIEAISKRPVKIIFSNEEAKKQILEVPENPFNMVFIVSGKVNRAEGTPVLYKINVVHDFFERPE